MKSIKTECPGSLNVSEKTLRTGAEQSMSAVSESLLHLAKDMSQSNAVTGDVINALTCRARSTEHGFAVWSDSWLEEHAKSRGSGATKGLSRLRLAEDRSKLKAGDWSNEVTGDARANTERIRTPHYSGSIIVDGPTPAASVSHGLWTWRGS